MYVISWSAASVIDRESDRSTRWIKEAVHIRKEGPRSMNRDDRSYQLIIRPLSWLDTNLSRREPEEEDLVLASSDEGLWQRSKRQKVNNFLVGFDEFCISMYNSTKWNFSQCSKKSVSLMHVWQPQAAPIEVGSPLNQLGGLGSAVSSPSGVRAGAPTENKFGALDVRKPLVAIIRSILKCMFYSCHLSGVPWRRRSVSQSGYPSRLGPL